MEGVRDDQARRETILGMLDGAAFSNRDLVWKSTMLMHTEFFCFFSNFIATCSTQQSGLEMDSVRSNNLLAKC